MTAQEMQCSTLSLKGTEILYTFVSQAARNIREQRACKTVFTWNLGRYAWRVVPK